MADFLEGKTQKIAYVGPKAYKTDTVAQTGIAWAGYGDVQEVPHGAAVKLIKFPSVWVTETEFKKLGKQPASEPKAPLEGGLSDSGTDGRTEEVVDAIRALDKNEDTYTAAGKPKVSAVKQAAGDETITAREVAEAWDIVNGS